MKTIQNQKTAAQEEDEEIQGCAGMKNEVKALGCSDYPVCENKPCSGY